LREKEARGKLRTRRSLLVVRPERPHRLGGDDRIQARGSATRADFGVVRNQNFAVVGEHKHGRPPTSGYPPYMRSVGRSLAVIGLLALAPLRLLDCGEDRHGERIGRNIETQLPTNTGELWGLCPAPDVPQDFYDEEARETRQATRALIREVRRRPDALVTLVSHDAHSTRIYREGVTVRELAEEHLRNPGVRGVPCQRRLMWELTAAVDGRAGPPPASVENERVYTVQQIVDALQLRDHGAIYRGPKGCVINDGDLYTSASEVELSLRGGGGEKYVLVTDRDRTVGVEVFRPSAACERELKRRLAELVGDQAERLETANGTTLTAPVGRPRARPHRAPSAAAVSPDG
jgi:hypothetical protein